MKTADTAVPGGEDWDEEEEKKGKVKAEAREMEVMRRRMKKRKREVLVIGGIGEGERRGVVGVGRKSSGWESVAGGEVDMENEEEPIID